MKINNTITLKKQGSPIVFLWGDYRERNIESLTQNIQIQKDYVILIDSIYRIVKSIMQGQEIETADIECVKHSFLYNSKIIYEEAGNRIVQLAHYSVIFGNMLDELSYNKQSAIRLRFIQAHWADFPPQKQADEILIRGLNDISIKVRGFSIERIMYFNLNYLLPNLKERYSVESHFKVKELLNDVISMFEKGYNIRSINEEKFSITFLHNDGLKSFLLKKIDLSEELITKEIAKRKS